MTRFERGRCEAGSGTENRAGCARSVAPRGLLLSLLSGLFVAAGFSSQALPAAAETAQPGFTADIVSVVLPIALTGGFGWPPPPGDAFAGLAVLDARAEAERRVLSLPVSVNRYEPPTVTQGPGGVTIVRGPGSRHGVSP